ncbi:MAG: peptidoglycan DD-metalloendopeptidase family protein [Pseudomonadota bacterium]
MSAARQLLLCIPIVASAACASGGPAPVVQGSATHQARIYNSPEDIYRKQQIAQQSVNPYYAKARAVSQQRAAIAQVESEPIKSVAAVYEPAPIAYPTKSATLEIPSKFIEVQAGDTVYAIGRRYGVNPTAIINANQLKAPYTLSIGQALRLPTGASAQVPKPAGDAFYKVKSGDTLYAVSRATGVMVATLAQENRLAVPYHLSVGQTLVIPGGAAAGRVVAVQQPKTVTIARAPVPETRTAPAMTEIARKASYSPSASISTPSFFEWPVRGAIVAEYGVGSLGRRNEGVNIAAPAGTPVRAAADGEVVYRGSELDGYGNLLLIKHEDGFVTAYAHNDAMLVRKGQKVRQGQIIAKVGQSGSVASPQLHFEVRQDLKSIDPVALLGIQ